MGVRALSLPEAEGFHLGGLGFRVWGSRDVGFRVWGSRVEGLGCLGFGATGLTV